MIHTAEFLRGKFDQAMSYDQFTALAAHLGQRGPWDQRYAQLALSLEQAAMVQSFTRTIHVLCMTGTWCGDCALQGAAMQRIAEASPDRIRLRFLQRDETHADLIVPNQINAGFRVPFTWFMAEDFEPVSRFGDRTLSRYRAMARKQLPEGAVLTLDPPPVTTDDAPGPADPVRAVLEEVLDEFERVHLLLRTSARLRQKHGD